MSVQAKVVCDSLAPCGARLISVQVTYPRIILAELNTHRDLSRNSASSRAVPIERMIARVLADPGKPVSWGKNQKGMSADEELDEAGRAAAEAWWDESMFLAVEQARKGVALGLHKQVVNRLTEPFQCMTTLVSATRWGNFFHQRDHRAADPTFQALARVILVAMEASEPRQLQRGEWHLPYVKQEDRRETLEMAGEVTHDSGQQALVALEMIKKLSVARCARTSHFNQEGVRALQDDLALHDRLIGAAGTGEPGHFSPFEHVARAEWEPVQSGNFVGFTQYRKLIPDECYRRGLW